MHLRALEMNTYIALRVFIHNRLEYMSKLNDYNLSYLWSLLFGHYLTSFNIRFVLQIIAESSYKHSVQQS